MTDELEYPPFIQGNTKEKPWVKLKNRNTDLPVPIDGCTEITFRCFSLDFQTLVFSGTKTGGKVTFSDDGTDGEAEYQPATDDMATVGQYRTEWEFTFSDTYVLRTQQILRITPKGPTS